MYLAAVILVTNCTHESVVPKLQMELIRGSLCDVYKVAHLFLTKCLLRMWIDIHMYTHKCCVVTMD